MKIFNVKEAASFLNCSESMIRKLIKNGEIIYFRLGRKIYFTKEAIENCILEKQNMNAKKICTVF